MAYSVLSDDTTKAKATVAADRARRDPMRWVVLAILILLLAFTLFPFFLALLNAVKASAEYAVGGPLSIPRSIDLTAIEKFWTVSDFSRKLLNSVVISLAVSVLGVLISLFNAYAIGVGKVPGSRLILVVFLLGIMVPQESIIYPLYYMAKASGLYDTQLSVIKAAEMDGSTHWKTLWFVIVPVLRPTLMVLGTFFFIWTWNEFLIPLVMLVSNNNQTVSVAMGLTRGQNMSDPVLQASAAFLGIIPTVIFFLIFQRTLTRGIAAGAVK
ncbi:MAG: carbohydrate ABC transporter permease [Rhizobium leguminosarum]|nr:carbohydrate ABC transporter permease [Rhizobium leguminosarum]